MNIERKSQFALGYLATLDGAHAFEFQSGEPREVIKIGPHLFILHEDIPYWDIRSTLADAPVAMQRLIVDLFGVDEEECVVDYANDFLERYEEIVSDDHLVALLRESIAVNLFS